MRIARSSFVGVALGAFAALPAFAHHGWGGNGQPIELSGTVVAAVDLSGPHATMQIRDSPGQVWNITLAPAPRTARTVPMASMPGVQLVGLTTTVDTVAAGGCMLAKNCEIILSRNRLKPTMPPTTRMSRIAAIMKRLIKVTSSMLIVANHAQRRRAKILQWPYIGVGNRIFEITVPSGR